MMKRVKCPGCMIALAFDTLAHDKGGLCPECGNLVLPPHGDADDDEPAPPRKRGEHAITERPDKRVRTSDVDSLPEVRSLDSQIEDLQWEGKSLARDHGARVDEPFDTEFDSKAELDRRVAELQREY